MTSKEAFAKTVPRETMQRLDEFESLLLKWNPKINLISKGDIHRVWRRHIFDSIQVFQAATIQSPTWFDFGSGAGFPGMVCAILQQSAGREASFHLVESDTRKAVFLRQAASALSLPVKVHSCRIEDLREGKADIISARALASLAQLLELSEPHIGARTQLLFPKGRKAEGELDQARESWNIRVERIPSLTDAEATIFKLTGVTKRL